jgi:hypothetical protein
MKNLLPFLAAVLVSACLHAQSTQYHFPDAFYFVKEVVVNDLKERPFHLEISVKENPTDSLSQPRIYAVQVRNGKEDLIGKTFTYAHTSSNGEWKTYAIDGIVDKQATRIWFFTAVNGNGNFIFDNLKCSIADINGTLLERDLSNYSFENKNILSGYFVSAKPSKNLIIRASKDAVEGKTALEVISTGQKPGFARTIAKN